MQTAATIIRNQIVTYVARNGRGLTVQARVDRCHRDGTCTVTARHFLDSNGKPDSSWLGYRYRIDAADLAAA
jgi:hypothetical protein